MGICSACRKDDSDEINTESISSSLIVENAVHVVRDPISKETDEHKKFCTLMPVSTINLKSNQKNNFAETNYLQRINVLLDMYSDIDHKLQNINNETSTSNIYGMIVDHYNDINEFMNDYAQYVENMDNNRVYSDNYNNKQQRCVVSDCVAIQREYGDRTQKRSELYCDSSDNIEITSVQMMDILHITKYHLVDMALRQKMQSHSQNIKTIVTQLKQKRNNFNHIRNDRTNFRKATNKFVTTIFGQDEEKYEENVDHDQTYSLGFRFYYHEHYRNNTGEQELVPGTTLLDQTNYIIDSQYRYCDWFIQAKYKNIREEVLNGQDVQLTKKQFNFIYHKTKLKHHAYKRFIKGADFKWEIVYEIKEKAEITAKHILSVLLYTNCSDLSFAFSSTFRRINRAENDEQLKQRHCEYANWGKLLRETVECWGTDLLNSKIKTFYHGISCKLLFNNLNACFAGPTSTTTEYTVAIAFASQDDAGGLVTKINNDGMSNHFFDCVIFSDYPYEQERLFIGGFQPVEISGITLISEELDCDEWIHAIRVFESALINGLPSSDGLAVRDMECIDILIKNRISNSGTKNEESNIVPLYVSNLFRNILNKVETINIDIGYLEKEEQYSKLFHIYFTEKKQVKWDVIQTLFPEVYTIYICHIDKIENQLNAYKYSPSILIDDCLLESLLSCISDVDNQWVYIFMDYPKNTSSNINQLISSHTTAYDKQEFQLSMITRNHSSNGSCRSLCITYNDAKYSPTKMSDT